MTASIKVGDIIQVDPNADNWGGCLVIVTEVQAFVRVRTEDFQPTGGAAAWTAA